MDTPKTFLRGKYELWFLFIFCKKVVEIILPQLNTRIEEHNKKNKVKISKCKIHIELKEANMIEITAPRVKIPLEVKKFIKGNIESLGI